LCFGGADVGIIGAVLTPSFGTNESRIPLLQLMNFNDFGIRSQPLPLKVQNNPPVQTGQFWCRTAKAADDLRCSGTTVGWRINSFIIVTEKRVLFFRIDCFLAAKRIVKQYYDLQTGTAERWHRAWLAKKHRWHKLQHSLSCAAAAQYYLY
jgi:hypothetical protein